MSWKASAALSLTDIECDMIEFREGRVFHRTLLSLLGLSVLAMSVLQVLYPVNTASHAPKMIKPAGVAKKELPQVRLLPVALPRRENVGRLSVRDLNTTFTKMGYELRRVQGGAHDVPRVFLSSLPYDLKQVKETEERKRLFFKTLLPLVLKINEEIIQDRAKVWRLRHRLQTGQAIRPQDRVWLDGQLKKYQLSSLKFDSLLLRMDVVPPSLALAQAAEESGWGTSRFAREGNALFGQWTLNPNDKGLVPTQRQDGKVHRIKAFDSLEDSLRSYVQNLNTHKAYKALRLKRSQMRTNRQEPDGLELAQQLDKYSERGQDYVTSLLAIMDHNNLGQFDHAALDAPSHKPAKTKGQPI